MRTCDNRVTGISYEDDKNNVHNPIDEEIIEYLRIRGISGCLD